MSSSLLGVFEQYQRSRVAFVTAVAEAATRPQNVDVMQHAGVMQLLRPLLLDNVPGIQQTAALALGRLASYSDDLAEAVVANDILPQLVYSLGEQNVRGPLPRRRAAADAPALALTFYPTLHALDHLVPRSAFTRRRRPLCCGTWPSTRRSSRRPSSTRARSRRSCCASRSLTLQ